MIKLTQGNVIEADVEALVNTVNCVGIMGKGIALQFKQAFRDNFQAYTNACRVVRNLIETAFDHMSTRHGSVLLSKAGYQFFHRPSLILRIEY